MSSTEPVAVVVPKELFYHEVAYVRGLEEENKRLRTELEAVKREAVEVLKPLVREGQDFYAPGYRDSTPISVSLGALRAARAFEKELKDGQ